MVKTAKPSRNTSANPRSRAARRATSPSIDTDKSITTQPRATDATPVLAPHRGNGILKKRKIKQVSRGQRVRHSKNLARAEAVADQLQSKISESSARLKKRQSRRALWEDVNETVREEERKAIKAPGRFEALDDEDETKEEIAPFHGDTEIKVIDGVLVPSFATGQTMTFTMGPTLGVQPPQNETKPAPVQEQATAHIVAESIPPVEAADEIT